MTGDLVTPGEISISAPSLVVVVGPSGSGKSTWAATWFAPSEVVSSDALRSLTGEGDQDQRASGDAFAVLDLVVERRLRRKLLTVVDSTGLESDRRRAYVAAARAAGVPVIAVVTTASAAECRTRNRKRERAVPAAVITRQLEAFGSVRSLLVDEGFDAVVDMGPVRIVGAGLFGSGLTAGSSARLSFGLQVSAFTWPGGPAEIADRLTAIAQGAEAAGFRDLWVMDHFRQIPQVGRAWDDMLESYTALAFVAAKTSSIRLGTMVAGVTYRNVGHLAKIVATLDVLSAGRAECGLGAAWFAEEHRAYGWEFPSVSARFTLLEDTLQALPVLWGPGNDAFHGKVLSLPDTTCYPRPLQARIPILVGGGGEKKTLRLVAQYADACNLMGDADVVRRKVGVLREHCVAVGRDPSTVKVTHLSTAVVGRDGSALAATIERLRPSGVPASRFATMVHAGGVSDHVASYRALAAAGVQHAVVSLGDVGDVSPVETFADVIDALQD
jgi:F420-dependent oxidoreductase-like protein